MIKHFSGKRILSALLIAFGTLAFAGGASAAQAPKKAAARTEKPAGPIGHVVDYKELENHVGEQVVIETTLGTLRRGTLIKYTNPALIVKLGPENGSIDLTVPHETVRSASVMDAVEPAPDDAGARSAKKN